MTPAIADQCVPDTLGAAPDTQRLDWLQEHQETVFRCTRSELHPSTSMFRHSEVVTVFEGWAVFHDQEPKPTIREAIDWAMRLHSAKDTP